MDAHSGLAPDKAVLQTAGSSALPCARKVGSLAGSAPALPRSQRGMLLLHHKLHRNWYSRKDSHPHRKVRSPACSSVTPRERGVPGWICTNDLRVDISAAPQKCLSGSPAESLSRGIQAARLAAWKTVVMRHRSIGDFIVWPGGNQSCPRFVPLKWCCEQDSHLQPRGFASRYAHLLHLRNMVRVASIALAPSVWKTAMHLSTPNPREMVAGLGYAPNSPRLQRGAFTRLAFQPENGPSPR